MVAVFSPIFRRGGVECRVDFDVHHVTQVAVRVERPATKITRIVNHRGAILALRAG